MLHIFRLMITLIFALATGLICCGCPGDDDDDTADDDTADDDTADDDSADDDSADDDTEGPPIPPCNGGWGDYVAEADADQYIHVRTPEDGGDDTGSGTASSPLATLDAALAMSREEGNSKLICVGSGDFEDTSLLLLTDAGNDQTDDGLAIIGCGASGVDETRFVAASDSSWVIKVNAAQGVELQHFATEGGRRAIWVWGGATTGMLDIVVQVSTRLGVIIGGWDTFVAAEGLVIEDTIPEIDDEGIEYGYGLSIQDAEVTLTDSSVSGSTKVGVLVNGGYVTISELTVDDTAADYNNYMGRGIQVQNDAMAVFDHCYVGVNGPNRDAGVFAQGALWMQMDFSEVHGTAEGVLPGETCLNLDCPGEGIVVSQGGLGEDPANFMAFLDENVVTSAFRAGILIDSVANDLNGNTLTDNGKTEGDVSIFFQGALDDINGDSVIAGTDPYNELSEGAELATNINLIEIDDLVD